MSAAKKVAGSFKENTATGFQSTMTVDRKAPRVVYQEGNIPMCLIKDEKYFFCSDTGFVASLMALGFSPVSDQPHYYNDRATWVYEDNLTALERMAHDFYGDQPQEDMGVTIQSFRKAFSFKRALVHLVNANKASCVTNRPLTLRRL